MMSLHWPMRVDGAAAVGIHRVQRLDGELHAEGRGVVDAGGDAVGDLLAVFGEGEFRVSAPQTSTTWGAPIAAASSRARRLSSSAAWRSASVIPGKNPPRTSETAARP